MTVALLVQLRLRAREQPNEDLHKPVSARTSMHHSSRTELRSRKMRQSTSRTLLRAVNGSDAIAPTRSKNEGGSSSVCGLL